MKINRAFIKGTNWALAGLISMLGFTGCNNELITEYGVPNADFTVKGTVIDKATGKPIAGIRVGYSPEPRIVPMYGPPSTTYQAKAFVTTDTKGTFKLTDHFSLGEYHLDDKNNPILPVYVEDIDGEQNGLYQSDTLQANFGGAERSGKPKDWYDGEFTITENVQLTEIKNQ